jgi:uncharacterized protein
MSADANARIVHALYEALSLGDFAAILDALHDDVEWHVLGPETIPWAGLRRGRRQVAEFFELVATTTHRDDPGHRPEVHELIAQGDRVVAFGRDRVGSRVNDRTYDGWWVHVFTLRDGKVAALREYFDTAHAQEMFRRAGAPEEPRGTAEA